MKRTILSVILLFLATAASAEARFTIKNGFCVLKGNHGNAFNADFGGLLHPLQVDFIISTSNKDPNVVFTTAQVDTDIKANRVKADLIQTQLASSLELEAVENGNVNFKLDLSSEAITNLVNYMGSEKVRNNDENASSLPPMNVVVASNGEEHTFESDLDLSSGDGYWFDLNVTCELVSDENKVPNL